MPIGLTFCPIIIPSDTLIVIWQVRLQILFARPLARGLIRFNVAASSTKTTPTLSHLYQHHYYFSVSYC